MRSNIYRNEKKKLITNLVVEQDQLYKPQLRPMTTLHQTLPNIKLLHHHRLRKHQNPGSNQHPKHCHQFRDELQYQPTTSKIKISIPDRPFFCTYNRTNTSNGTPRCGIFQSRFKMFTCNNFRFTFGFVSLINSNR